MHADYLAPLLLQLCFNYSTTSMNNHSASYIAILSGHAGYITTMVHLLFRGLLLRC